MTMPVSLYEHVPESGSIAERRYDAGSFCTFVRFEPEFDEPWAGVFGNGTIRKRTKDAVLFGDNRHAFVIAAGQGYVVDIETGELLQKTDYDYFGGAITVPQQSFVVAHDDLSLYLIHPKTVGWQSERIARFGITLETATPTRLIGALEQHNGWYRFEFSYENRDFSIESQPFRPT
jgi:hypothetical protein